MTALTRRTMLRLLAGAAFLPGTARGAEKALVGAIRWDAWYSPKSRVTTAVEASLNPPAYRWRAPFFAIEDPGKVQMPTASQELIDLEIRQAAYAGIDYWAFVAYDLDSDLSKALKFYLSSQLKSRVRFCMFTALESWGTANQPSALIEAHLQLMKETSYVKVNTERPLYFLGFIEREKVDRLWGGFENLRRQISNFRQRARSLGLQDPYIVLAGRMSELDQWAGLGGDALSAYSIATPHGPSTFASLAQTATQTWRQLSSSGMPVIPTVMAGWDRRPRVEHPVPWESQIKGSDLNDYYAQPSPTELASHLRDGIAFAAAQEKNRAPAVLIYAWNENDEGGWVIPTQSCNEERLLSVRSATISEASPSPGCRVTGTTP